VNGGSGQCNWRVGGARQQWVPDEGSGPSRTSSGLPDLAGLPFLPDDQSECIVLERYKDSEALIEHTAHVADLMQAILATGSVSGELLGEPSMELRAKLAGSGVRLFTPFQSMWPPLAGLGRRRSPTPRSIRPGAAPRRRRSSSWRTDAFHGPSQRKWDKRVHFAPVVAPCNDSERAARQWAIAEAATGVHYLSGVHL
jgi:hypothetical protein